MSTPQAPAVHGRREGDLVICGYHGLTFDCSAPAWRPRPRPNSSTARVRSYPVADRWGLTWIWMAIPNLPTGLDYHHRKL